MLWQCTVSPCWLAAFWSSHDQAMCFCELLHTQKVQSLCEQKVNDCTSLHNLPMWPFTSMQIFASRKGVSLKFMLACSHCNWHGVAHIWADSLIKQCCYVCTLTTKLAKNARQRMISWILLNPVVASIFKSAGCFRSPGRLLQADGTRQAGPDWLQNLATYICLHHPTGDSLLARCCLAVVLHL